MARVERPPGPLRARQLRLRRALGRTRPGRALKRLLGREVRIPIAAEPDSAALIAFPGEDELPEGVRDKALLEAAVASRARALASPPSIARSRLRGLARRAPLSGEQRPVVNVVLVSHCDFTGNSAFHVYAIASELHRHGVSPVMVVPDHAETVEDLGRPPFPVLTYAEARSNSLRFPDGRGPDLVHAFTPRELVRRLTVDLVRAHGCRYVVHLEDSEEAVLSAEHGGASITALKELPAPMLDRIVRPRQAHPLRAVRFLEQAAGVTVLTDRLLEFVPPGVPAAVVPAGFDEAVLSPRRPRDEVRAELRLADSDIVIVYPGNIHMVNIEEMRSLYAAVAELRRAGHPVVLVKTGWGSTQTVTFPALGPGLRDLGWVPRNSIPGLLGAADILVQPGGPSPFNDYRFPSKLPEFLASGKPVVLPRTNIGLALTNDREAILLDRGDATEIATAVARLANDPGLRRRIGEAGRVFALRELRWSRSVARIQELYSQAASSRPPPLWALEGADPPVKLIAIAADSPSDNEEREARTHGIYGFIRPDDVEESIGDGKPTEAYDALMCKRLATPASGSSVPVIPFPPDHALDERYVLWLRKLVLQTLVRYGPGDAFILVDVRNAWPDLNRRAACLKATQAALRDGIHQYYASRQLTLTQSELDEIVKGS